MNDDPKTSQNPEGQQDYLSSSSSQGPINDNNPSDATLSNRSAGMEEPQMSNYQVPGNPTTPQEPPDSGQMNPRINPVPSNQERMIESTSKDGPMDQSMQNFFTREEVEGVRSHWKEIQVQFIDSPCAAVEQGDTLVNEVLERLKEAITRQQELLNKQWLNNDGISTEELRITLRNYRLFLDRLLSLSE